MKLLDLQTGKYLEIGYDWGYYGTKISLKQKQQEAILGHLQFDRQSMKELSKPNEYSMRYQLSLTAMEATDDILLKIADVLIEQGTIGIQPHTDPIINKTAEKVGAVVYGGRYVLFKEKSFNYKPYEEIANKIILLYDKAMLYFNDERCNKLNQKKHNELNEDENKYFDSIYFSSYEFKEKCEKITESYGKRFCVDDRILPERYCKNEVYTREEAYNMILNDVKKHCTYIKNIEIQYSNIFEEYSKQLRNQPNKFEELYYLIYGTK